MNRFELAADKPGFPDNNINSENFKNFLVWSKISENFSWNEFKQNLKSLLDKTETIIFTYKIFELVNLSYTQWEKIPISNKLLRDALETWANEHNEWEYRNTISKESFFEFLCLGTPALAKKEPKTLDKQWLFFLQIIFKDKILKKEKLPPPDKIIVTFGMLYKNLSQLEDPDFKKAANNFIALRKSLFTIDNAAAPPTGEETVIKNKQENKRKLDLVEEEENVALNSMNPSIDPKNPDQNQIKNNTYNTEGWYSNFQLTDLAHYYYSDDKKTVIWESSLSTFLRSLADKNKNNTTPNFFLPCISFINNQKDVFFQDLSSIIQTLLPEHIASRKLALLVLVEYHYIGLLFKIQQKSDQSTKMQIEFTLINSYTKGVYAQLIKDIFLGIQTNLEKKLGEKDIILTCNIVSDAFQAEPKDCGFIIFNVIDLFFSNTQEQFSDKDLKKICELDSLTKITAMYLSILSNTNSNNNNSKRFKNT